MQYLICSLRFERPNRGKRHVSERPVPGDHDSRLLARRCRIVNSYPERDNGISAVRSVSISTRGKTRTDSRKCHRPSKPQVTAGCFASSIPIDSLQIRVEIRNAWLRPGRFQPAAASKLAGGNRPYRATHRSDCYLRRFGWLS